MSNDLNKFYSDDFYAGQIDGSARSAKVILSLLFKHYLPSSIVDVGCGKGSWLSVAESLGCKTLKGFDGHWVAKSNLLSQNIDFTPIDFETDFTIDNKYDLAMSLEVAEHVTQPNATKFVDRLCNAADIVLFAAAIKFQGGTHHVNEQPQSYWIEIFESNGYECIDFIRPQIWENEEVESWYRQNIFLFVRKDCKTIDTAKLKEAEKPIKNIVHPDSYRERSEPIYHPTLTNLYRTLKRYIAHKLGILKT